MTGTGTVPSCVHATNDVKRLSQYATVNGDTNAAVCAQAAPHAETTAVHTRPHHSTPHHTTPHHSDDR